MCKRTNNKQKNPFFEWIMKLTDVIFIINAIKRKNNRRRFLIVSLLLWFDKLESFAMLISWFRNHIQFQTYCCLVVMPLSAHIYWQPKNIIRGTLQIKSTAEIKSFIVIAMTDSKHRMSSCRCIRAPLTNNYTEPNKYLHIKIYTGCPQNGS